jgi:hypothetical protein
MIHSLMYIIYINYLQMVHIIYDIGWQNQWYKCFCKLFSQLEIKTKVLSIINRFVILFCFIIKIEFLYLCSYFKRYILCLINLSHIGYFMQKKYYKYFKTLIYK